MISILVIFLIVMDIGLLYVIYTMHQKWQSHDQVLSDITEERQLIAKIQENLRTEIKDSEGKVSSLLQRVNKISAEIEIEIKNSSETIAKNLEEITTDLSSQFELPIKQIAKRQQSLEKIFLKVSQEREILAGLLERSESLIKFFNKDLSYQDVLKDIEQKRYQDVRRLLTKGCEIDEIAHKLGIPISEIKMIDQMSGF